MYVTWAVLCETAITDAESNNISLITLIDHVALPIQPPKESKMGILGSRLAVITLWRREDPSLPEQGEGRIRFLSPDGTELLEKSFPINLSKFIRMRTRLQLPGLPFGGVEGHYNFVFDYKSGDAGWDHRFELPLQIDILGEGE